MRGSLTRLWQTWRELTVYFGDFQAKLLLTLVYFTVLAPFGLLAHLLSDPLEVRDRARPTGWRKRPIPKHDTQALQRQF